jgi:hypothetical protein
LLTYGRDDGVAATETSWQKKFDTAVADKVKEQVPIEFKKELDDANVQIAAKDRTIRDLAARNDSLQRELQDAVRKATIYELFDNLVRQASTVRAGFARGRRERDNFRRLLTQIHHAHEAGSRWAGLFDDQATQLYERLQRDEPVSDQEILAFLASFTSDPKEKREIVEELAQLGTEAQAVRD